MKKQIIILVSVLILMIVCLTGCELFGDGGLFSSNLAAPSVSVMGCVVTWEEVNQATLYEIYKDGVLAQTTSDNYYVCKDNTENVQITVVAVDEEKGKASEASAAVLVRKQGSFEEDETMNIKLNSDEAYVVPSKINYVTISGTAENVYVSIENRNTDLTIMLNNVSMTSPSGKSCIGTADGSYDSKQKRYSVIIKAVGNNDLTAGDCTKVPDGQSGNSNKGGNDGYDGSSALCLAQIVVTGSGSLAVTGGKGGVGGAGAGTSGVSLSMPADGGDGGDGGNGIATTKVIVCMDSTGSLSAYGGAGGNGGIRGTNGSLMTGPWSSLLGTTGNNGDIGNTGKGIIGEVVLLSGIISNEE